MFKNLLPPTTKRVCYHTKDNINKIIRNKTISNLNSYKNSGEKTLSNRIEKLNYEWDTERIIETSASSVVLAGSIIGLKKSKSIWYLLTGTAGLFLLQHALQGWCPSLPVIRRLGIRTEEEISNEKYALKILRGDLSQHDSYMEELVKATEKQ